MRSAANGIAREPLNKSEVYALRPVDRMRPSTETVGDILVTIDRAQFNAEPRCDILAAIAEHREIRQVLVQMVERDRPIASKVCRHEALSAPHVCQLQPRSEI